MGFLFKLSLLIFILAIITFGFSYYLKNYSSPLDKNVALNDKSKKIYPEQNIITKQNNSTEQPRFFDQNEVRVLVPVEEKRKKPIENNNIEEATITDLNEELKQLEIKIEAKEFKFEPNIFVVKENQPVKLIIKNSGNIPHNLKIEKDNIVFQTSLIAPGEEAVLEFKAPVKGEYDFYCTLSDHKIRGMFGKMIVE